MTKMVRGVCAAFGLLLILIAFGAPGCTISIGGGGNVNDNAPANDNGSGSVTGLRVGFTGNSTGMFAAATDDEGTEYTYFTTEDDNGDVRLTEVNARTADDMIVKVSLDEFGRPVNFRGNDGAIANVLYNDDGSAKVAAVENEDDEGEVVDGVDVGDASTTAKGITRLQRRQGEDDLDVLSIGLSVFDDIAFSLFACEGTAPTCGSSLAEPSLRIASTVEVLDVSVSVEITEIEVIEQIIVIEEVPQDIRDLEGSWVLCSRDGFLAQSLGVENILTFGSETRPDILITEFDRQNVFDLTSLFGDNDGQGVTVNYLSGQPLPPQFVNGVQLQLTPVYSATSLDSRGRIAVDRRFSVLTSGAVSGLPLSSQYQINAALENGIIDGNVLSFDLRVIDLQNELAYEPIVQLTYVRQGTNFCEVLGGGDTRLQLFCPAGPMAPFESAEVAVSPPDNFGAFQVQWYLLSGAAIFEDDTSLVTNVVALDASATLRIAVSVVDVIGKYAEAECFIDVIDFVGSGDICFDNGWYNDGICDEFCPFFDEDCEVTVDLCAINGWYGDGVCDAYCFEPDPDCEVIIVDDICAENGWYCDGICDDFCLDPDPDCFGGCEDQCEANGFYGDGICDDFCPLPDSDCFGGSGDFCFDNGYYGDGFCDEFCPALDPDCFPEDDICAENGWYGDGFCDDFCPQPDPDCSGGGDLCEENGYYGDGFCDDFCPQPDPDCSGGSGDFCFANDLYGDGFCDDFCPEPDPDCDSSGDICEENGWYGDGTCDDFCPLPDPDCP